MKVSAPESRTTPIPDVWDDLKRKTRFALPALFVLLGQLSCTQQRVENRSTLDKYVNGQIMREHVKYEGNDTIVEFIYFQNGRVNYKRQLLNNQKTGWSYTYNKEGELLFIENYLNGNLEGAFKAFYPTGRISRIEHYRDNRNIDTTTYYNTSGQLTKEVAFLEPCDFGSCECTQVVIVYENGSKVYSYEVENGLKSENHTVYDQTAYLRLMAKSDGIPLYDTGKSIFRKNCGMCHKVDEQVVGISLASFSKTMSEDELAEILSGSKGHPSSEITEKEAEAVIEYINRNCP